MLLENTHREIVLSLGDKMLSQVSKEKIATGLWKKFESLYMTKFLVKCLYLKQALYSYKISIRKAT